ncbi:MAG TPA: response regulator transcription factor [Terriglobia bacterium]|nr:response regulator transcription factor [Terriglobia bacterium]
MTTPLTSARILVVDDEPQIRRVLRTALVAGGYTVRDVRSGEEALEKLREERPDLTIVDINLPGISGFEVCREIRETSDAPIIMLSVRNSEKDKVKALDAGADDYVVKPFGTQELLARIRANLRRHAHDADEPPLSFAVQGLTIDFARRTVTARGRNVRLTPKEFDLLHYLVTHANKAVPHRELLQSVWGPDYGEETEYLRVFVNQLRKKIEADPARPKFLLTEPWVGYRFALPEKA